MTYCSIRCDRGDPPEVKSWAEPLGRVVGRRASRPRCVELRLGRDLNVVLNSSGDGIPGQPDGVLARVPHEDGPRTVEGARQFGRPERDSAVATAVHRRARMTSRPSGRRRRERAMSNLRSLAHRVRANAKVSRRTAWTVSPTSGLVSARQTVALAAHCADQTRLLRVVADRATQGDNVVVDRP